MKLSPALIALVTLATIAVCALIGAVVLVARGVEVPVWLSSAFSAIVSFLVGLALPSPLPQQGRK